METESEEEEDEEMDDTLADEALAKSLAGKRVSGRNLVKKGKQLKKQAALAKIREVCIIWIMFYNSLYFNTPLSHTHIFFIEPCK